MLPVLTGDDAGSKIYEAGEADGPRRNDDRHWINRDTRRFGQPPRHAFGHDRDHVGGADDKGRREEVRDRNGDLA